MSVWKVKQERFANRQARVHKSVRGDTARPRLTVCRTNAHIYAQIIDDVSGSTLASASSIDTELRTKVGKNSGNKSGAAMIGEALAGKAIAKGITKVVFDRGGRRYHGRVKELADAARKAGLQF